jgi:hypothetical protein
MREGEREKEREREKKKKNPPKQLEYNTQHILLLFSFVSVASDLLM